MKIKITKASDGMAYRPIIKEGVTAEDILNLIDQYKEDIIIGRPCDYGEEDCDCDYTITIYDDWVE